MEKKDENREWQPATTFPWVRYDVASRAWFCTTCELFSSTGKNDKTFCFGGPGSKMMRKCNLEKHAKSSCHVANVDKKISVRPRPRLRLLPGDHPRLCPRSSSSFKSSSASSSFLYLFFFLVLFLILIFIAVLKLNRARCCKAQGVDPTTGSSIPAGGGADQNAKLRPFV